MQHLYKSINQQKTEQKYIAQLVTEGYELDKLIEIYKFWLDTDEDIELIKKIYDAYDPINEEEDNHWVEEVYNQITENKYGGIKPRTNSCIL